MDTRPPELGEPPWDPARALAWLTFLAEADEEADPEELRRLRSEAQTAPLARLHALVSDPRATHAVDVADLWQEAGHTEEEAIQLLARLLTETDLAQGWRQWEDVADRAEIRLRLHALARAEAVDAGLEGFLTFFFRASDPELYRWAGVAIGRHVEELPEARSYLRSWAQVHGFELARPAKLDGDRGARRLLFVQTGAALRPEGSPTSVEIADARQVLRSIGEGPPAELSAHDLAVTLRASHLLAAHEDGLDETVASLLEGVQTLPRERLDRNLLEAWASLFAHARQRAAGTRAERLDGALAALARHGLADLRAATGLGETVAALEGLDHLVRAIVPLEPGAARPLTEKLLAPAQGVEARWLHAQLRTWASRQRGPGPDEIVPAQAPSTERDLPEPIPRVLAHVWPDPDPQAFLDSRAEAALSLLDELLDLFSDERDWKARNRRARALGLFAVLDLLRHEPLPAERLRAMVDRHGITLGDPRGTEGDRAQRRAAIARVLARVVDWEEASGDPLLDARTIHEVDDTLLLLGFVPTGRQPTWLPSMADAIENRFRWRLRRDATFNPVAFLARLTIREPHPQLYDTLARVSQTRTYPVPGHEAGFPLSEVAGDLAEQARAARRGAPLAEILQAWDPTPLARFDPLARDLARVREALAGLAESPRAPGAGAHDLAELVGRADPRGKAGGPTILGLLSQLHASHRPVPRPGDPPWTRNSLEVYLRAASDEATEVARLADQLETGVDVHEMRALLEQLRTSVTSAVDALVDGLPLAETRLLHDRAGKLDQAQARWLAALTAIEDVHDEALAGGEEAWTKLLATATRRWTGQALADILLRLWRSLLDPPRPAGTTPEPHETWERRARLVRWAATTPIREEWATRDREAWDEEIARSYEALLEEVMEANREDWVLALLGEEAYRRARTVEIVQDTLQEARDWCRDRYRLSGALSARRALAEQRQEAPPGLVREAGAFVTHFSPVWSALLVGAIFMLDFGDAWLDLARAGDVRGIALTGLIGVAGAYLYVVRDLKSKVAPRPGETTSDLRSRLLGRSAAFTALCIVVATIITTFLWWLLGASDAVIRGPWAVANIAVWTGFALFVGIVFGLVIQKGI